MANKSERPPITPNMKVGELLNYYPELENILMDMSPAFAKLKNPVLRRTIARVATLGQAASVGNIKIADLINTLRKAAGFEVTYETVENDIAVSPRPSWLEESKITEIIDACPMIEKGEQPLALVFQKLNMLEDGEIIELITPFYPAPIIDKARSTGYEVWSEDIEQDKIISYFLRIK